MELKEILKLKTFGEVIACIHINAAGNLSAKHINLMIVLDKIRESFDQARANHRDCQFMVKEAMASDNENLEPDGSYIDPYMGYWVRTRIDQEERISVFLIVEGERIVDWRVYTPDAVIFDEPPTLQ